VAGAISLVRVPFDLRLAIISWVAVTASFSDREFDEMAVMAELESLYMMVSGGGSRPCRKLVSGMLYGCDFHMKMLPFVNIQACS
jgi:hypothetical protein